MAISLFDHINQLWHELLNDALSALRCSCRLGGGRPLDYPIPGSDITTYMTLHAILEDSFVYGLFLRDKDIVIRRGDSFQILAQVVDGLRILFGSDFGLDWDLNALCRYTIPCGDVRELSDGLMRVMSAVWTNTTSGGSALDSIVIEMNAFLSLFTLSFLGGVLRTQLNGVIRI